MSILNRARALAGARPRPRRAAPLLRWTFILAGLLSLAASTGCATVTLQNQDTPVRSRTEKKLLSDWTFTAFGAVLRDEPGQPRTVGASAHKDKACSVTDIKTVDRTVVTNREMVNARRGRIMGYTMGSLGAAGAATNIYFATQTRNESEQIGFGILAGVGVYLSITLVMQIVREFEAIDTEEHIGLVDVSTTRRDRCEGQPAVGAKVRLLRTKSAAVAEGVIDSKGGVTLPVDVAAQGGDVIYALEVNGVITSYIEVPGQKP